MLRKKKKCVGESLGKKDRKERRKERLNALFSFFYACACVLHFRVCVEGRERERVR